MTSDQEDHYFDSTHGFSHIHWIYWTSHIHLHAMSKKGWLHQKTPIRWWWTLWPPFVHTCLWGGSFWWMMSSWGISANFWAQLGMWSSPLTIFFFHDFKLVNLWVSFFVNLWPHLIILLYSKETIINSQIYYIQFTTLFTSFRNSHKSTILF